MQILENEKVVKNIEHVLEHIQVHVYRTFLFFQFFFFFNRFFLFFFFFKLKMNRQIDNIKFRIQRELTLYDDEIQRLKNLHEYYNEKILESKDKLSLLTVDVENKKLSKRGITKRVGAAFGTLSARHNSLQYHRIQALELYYREEVRNMQEEFQRQMQNINLKTQMMLSTKFASIAKRKEKLIEFQKELTSRLSHLSVTNFWEQDDNSEIHNMRLQELRKTIISMNNERLTNLQRNKIKLQTCVEKLEEMENHFRSLFNEKIMEIQHLDYRYDLDIKHIESQHNFDISALKYKLHNMKRSCNSLEQTRQSVIAQGRARIDSVLEQYRITQSSTQARKAHDEEISDNYDQLMIQLESKQQQLAQRERLLAAAREHNMSLKRQIALKKHQLRFGIHP